MSTVQITTEDGKLYLSSPYHPNLPAQARQIGGKFHRASSSWVFDPRDEQRVRELAHAIYGTDGTATQFVTIRVHLDKYRNGPGLWVCGRELATRQGRDTPVRLGDGVIIVEGGFDGRGGSVKNPRLDPKDGTVLEVRDVPAGHPSLEDLDEKDGIVIARDEPSPEPDYEALRSEKEHLEARLEEIRTILGE